MGNESLKIIIITLCTKTNCYALVRIFYVKYLDENILLISLLKFLVADQNHKWGASSMHYVVERKKYALEKNIEFVSQLNLG